jgi:cytoskeletal protein CcmA (bactofilin family)
MPKHLDEMTCLLYIERQLDRNRALEVSAHTQSCAECRTLLHALERESRLLTRAMLEDDEPLPARIAAFQQRMHRSMQWIWGAVFALAATGVYALYTSYIEPLQQQLEQAGFGGTNLLGLLVFQGAFWKGWQSMFTLFEVLALVTLAAGCALFLRKRLRRTSALAMVLTSLCLVLGLPSLASASMDCRKGETVEVGKDETIKGDAVFSGTRVRMDGTIEGDIFIFAESADINGHVMGDVISFAKNLRIKGQVDGNVRSFVNSLVLSGTVNKNILSFNETTTIDSSGKIGGSLTEFAESVAVDGKVGRDFLGFFKIATFSGTVDGTIDGHGDSLRIDAPASIGGHVHFKGHNAPTISQQAKVPGGIEFDKVDNSEHEHGAGRFIWLLIWTAASVLLGLVLFALMPGFARETVGSGEQYGISLGLGVLVLFGTPIAAVIACITVVGLMVGISAFILWMTLLWCSGIVVGAVIGQWIMGHTRDIWPLIGRMVVGLVIIRAIEMVPYIGFWVRLGVAFWGVGAISLALYRRLQPVIAPGIPPAPAGPANPLPPNTTVGGMQTA